jgi:hypothetical protein
MKTNFDGQNMDLEIAVSRKPARKSRKKTTAEQPDVEQTETLNEPQPEGETRSAERWADRDLATNEPDDLGALGAELEKLVDWVDEVDPLTGEVTRRPILKASGENTPEAGETDADPGDLVKAGPDPAIQQTDPRPAQAPAACQSESGYAGAGTAGESGLSDVHAAGKQEAEQKSFGRDGGLPAFAGRS